MDFENPDLGFHTGGSRWPPGSLCVAGQGLLPSNPLEKLISEGRLRQLINFIDSFRLHMCFAKSLLKTLAFPQRGSLIMGLKVD